ncbi:MAG TPA: glycosyltransferase family 2 protein [Patescibacteria group bacterium]|nr:glycosyltransferase family 2 protein [Patescibacteria group bacterium]
MSNTTAIVHTKNSQETLEQCLKSLHSFADIWVVDSDSSDKSLVIAQKYATKVFKIKTDIPFADPLRNQFLQKVKTEWTLIVDSDEEIPETLAKKLQELSLTQGIAGYRIPRKNIIFGKWIEHTGFWPDYIVRFFRTGTCLYPPFVHAQPVIDGQVGDITALEEYAIIHHHYDTISQYLSRLNTYTSLEVEKDAPADYNLRTANWFSVFFGEFNRRFFADHGYLDGSYGLILSFLQSIYQLVVAMKRWEIKKENESISLRDIESQVNEQCSNVSYWSANEEIKSSKNIFQKVSLMFWRKIHS